MGVIMLGTRKRARKRARLRKRGWSTTLASMAACGRTDEGVGLKRLIRSAGFAHAPVLKLIIKRDKEPVPDFYYDDLLDV